MKRTTANFISPVIVVAVFCLFPVGSAFSQDQDNGLNKALDAVESSTRRHIEVLTDLLSKVPEEAKPSIEHAVAVSKRGRNIAVEAVELARVSDPLRKASLRTIYAERRLEDIQAMRSKGKPEFIETLTKDYESAIGGAMEDIVKARAQGRDVSEALNAVERSTKKHTEVLTGLLGKVPEQAKPAIARAIEVSKRGRNRALDALNKIQRGEVPIGKPEGIGRPEGVGKPEQERDKPRGRVGKREEERGRPEDKPGRSGESGRPGGGGGAGRGKR